MNLSSQKSAIALSASAAALLMPVSAFAEDGAAGADILIPKMAEFIPALIAFLIIWIVLAKVALPGIMKTMEERGKKIEESLDEAEKTKQEAIAKRAESDSIVTDARRQAADIVLEARKDAESERARIIELLTRRPRRSSPRPIRPSRTSASPFTPVPRAPSPTCPLPSPPRSWARHSRTRPSRRSSSSATSRKQVA